MTPARSQQLPNRSGVGLIHAMMALSLVAIFALVAASIAINEKRSATHGVAHTTAFLSADSGAEAAIAWLSMQDDVPFVRRPGMKIPELHSERDGRMDLEDTRQRYSYSIRVRTSELDGAPTQRPRPGYQLGDQGGYADVFYVVQSRGEAADAGESHVDLLVSKLRPCGY